MRRDADTDQRLQGAGWETIRIWEHQPPEAAASWIAERVAARRTKLQSRQTARRLDGN
jgi:DNA mismatch endonuclease (patch repair protein)